MNGFVRFARDDLATHPIIFRGTHAANRQRAATGRKSGHTADALELMLRFLDFAPEEQAGNDFPNR